MKPSYLLTPHVALLLVCAALSLPKIALTQKVKPGKADPPLAFTVINLGLPNDDIEAGPSSLNKWGDAVCTYTDPQGVERAYLYRKGKLSRMETFGGENSRATCINDLGQVAGMARTPDGKWRSFLWQKGNVRELERVAPASFFGAAADDSSPKIIAINNSGLIIGERVGTHGVKQTVFWDEEKARSVKQGEPELPRFSLAALNNRGQVVGTRYSDHRIRPDCAMVWEAGRVRELLPLGDETTSFHANDIQENGRVVVGAGSTEGVYKTHACLWEGDAAPRDLGVLPHGEESEANAINARGQIVGWSEMTFTRPDGVESPGDNHAVLWNHRRMYDLNKLIPEDSGWELREAVAINDKGQILAIGTHREKRGGSQAALLTPVPPR